VCQPLFDEVCACLRTSTLAPGTAPCGENFREEQIEERVGPVVRSPRAHCAIEPHQLQRCVSPANTPPAPNCVTESRHEHFPCFFFRRPRFFFSLAPLTTCESARHSTICDAHFPRLAPTLRVGSVTSLRTLPVSPPCRRGHVCPVACFAARCPAACTRRKKTGSHDLSESLRKVRPLFARRGLVACFAVRQSLRARALCAACVLSFFCASRACVLPIA
jgi:hypothetical protein